MKKSPPDARRFPSNGSTVSSGSCEEHVPEAVPIPETGSRYKTDILQSLRRIIRAVDIYSHKLATNYRVTGPQLMCLIAIVEKGPLTATGIARTIHLSPSTVVGILARLEEKGLIIRQRSVKDRRQIHVMPTDNGRRLVEEAPSPLQDTLARALSELQELEQATIALSLSRIVELMEAPDFDSSTIFDTPEEYEEIPVRPENAGTRQGPVGGRFP